MIEKIDLEISKSELQDFKSKLYNFRIIKIRKSGFAGFQISNVTMEYLQLKDDLSETIGEPVLMFRGNAGPRVLTSRTKGCFVTDGPYLWKNKTGKLLMIWASFGKGGNNEGVAFSESGKLAGPWLQQTGL